MNPRRSLFIKVLLWFLMSLLLLIALVAGIFNLDFRLRPGSVAVDTGINLDLPETDLDGAPRHVGQAVDLGAFEQQ